MCTHKDFLSGIYILTDFAPKRDFFFKCAHIPVWIFLTTFCTLIILHRYTSVPRYIPVHVRPQEMPGFSY